MQACLVAEKAKSAEAAISTSQYAELSTKFHEQLKVCLLAASLLTAMRLMSDCHMTIVQQDRGTLSRGVELSLYRCWEPLHLH